MGVVLYGRTSYVIDNILTFLRFGRNDYYSICLDYCNSSNFEQIIKAPHMLCQALWCFIIIYMVAHISVALIFYLYYTDIFLFCQMSFLKLCYVYKFNCICYNIITYCRWRIQLQKCIVEKETES